MPRTARLLIDDGTYHVLTRGNNGQQVFHQDADFQRYLALLGSHAQEYGIALHHFALMPNHVHLVLRVGRAETLSKLMLRLNLTYAHYYRKRHGYSGHLWQGRFKSLHIERESHLLECGRYVELNPVRASLVREPAAYAWTSYCHYAGVRGIALLAPNSIYETLGRTAFERQRKYRAFVEEGMRRHAELFTGPASADGDGRHAPSLERWLGLHLTRRPRGRPRKQLPAVSTQQTGHVP